MLRLVSMKAFALVLLAACAARAPSSPTWPALHRTARDGGESLAPRESNPVAAAAATEVEDDPVPDVPVVVAPVAPVAKPAEPGVVAPPAKPDEPIMTEEQIIEIDD